MSRTFTPGPAYRVFLERLYEARLARGHSLEQLSEIIGLTTSQIAAFEAGEHPLTFTDVRNWLLALDVPFVTFARELDNLTTRSTPSSKLTRASPFPATTRRARRRRPTNSPVPSPCPTKCQQFKCFSSRPDKRPRCAASKTRLRPSKHWFRA